MTLERNALHRSLELINTSCGIEAFFDKLLDLAFEGESLKTSASKLPVYLPPKKLRNVVQAVRPDMLPLWDIATVKQRRPAMQLYVSGVKAETSLKKMKRAVLLSLYEPGHWLFQYFTSDWLQVYNGQVYSSTKVRGIEWGFTFLTWIQWWVLSGHFADRGPYDGYVMCRTCDEGPYNPSNCYCATGTENVRDGHRFAAQREQGLTPTMPAGRFYPWTGVTTA